MKAAVAVDLWRNRCGTCGACLRFFIGDSSRQRGKSRVKMGYPTDKRDGLLQMDTNEPNSAVGLCRVCHVLILMVYSISG